MKIRIKDNSIRLRLTKSEVAAFAENGQLLSKTQLPQGQFTYELATYEGETLGAKASPDGITLLFPASEAAQWPSSDRVGYEHHLPLSEGQSLYLLVEKDFVCLDETVEDQSDNYPNPLANK